MLKGQCHEIFDFCLFSLISSPEPLVYWLQILPPVSTTPAANLPLVSTTLAKLVAKFADGFVDTGGKVCQQYTQGLGGTDS